MRTIMFKQFDNLKQNEKNKITFFNGIVKQTKTFKEFHNDVQIAVRKMSKIGIKEEDKVGIIGYTSYNYMVLDYACIIIGAQSIAIPETFSIDQQKTIDEKVDLKYCFVDYAYQNQIGVSKEKIYIFNSTEDCENNFDHIEGVEEYDFSKNRIQEDFSIVFSSGTSEKLKYIKRSFLDLTEKQKKKPSLLQKIKLFITIKRRGSIWTELKGKKNKIIIFLPFSHPMQRDFARICLGENIDIVLSDPQNCIKHIMLEKPNIMISVPPLYDALAELIRSRVLKFNNEEKKKYEEYLKKGIYKRSNTNKKKQHYQNTLFKKIKKIYGGSADLFITGSAPIKKETLETFYKVGVKIYEAYGQSELGTTIMNNPKNFRIGSIGKPNKKIVKLGENNEILVKFNKEIDTKNEDILTVENNFIKTGDAGYFDKDGFLFVTGRIDDVIVLDKGKKVHPKAIEEKFDLNHSVAEICVFSKDKHSISAVIFSENKNEQNVKAIVENVNKTLARHEVIKNFVLIQERPSLENGLLTRTMKLKRKSAIELFENSQIVTL